MSDSIIAGVIVVGVVLLFTFVGKKKKKDHDPYDSYGDDISSDVGGSDFDDD